jgi:hypothetical protein
MLGACPQSSSVRSHPIPIPRTWCPYLVPVPTSRVQSRTWCLSPPVEFSPVPRVLGACPHQSSSVRSRVLAAPWCLSPVDRSVPRTWCLSPPVEFSPVPRACCSFVLGACPHQSSSVRSRVLAAPWCLSPVDRSVACPLVPVPSRVQSDPIPYLVPVPSRVHMVSRSRRWSAGVRCLGLGFSRGAVGLVCREWKGGESSGSGGRACSVETDPERDRERGFAHSSRSGWTGRYRRPADAA